MRGPRIYTTYSAILRTLRARQREPLGIRTMEAAADLARLLNDDAASPEDLAELAARLELEAEDLDDVA
jgi:hypothetical protein